MNVVDALPNAVLWVTVSIVIYAAASALYTRIKTPLLLPVLVTITALIVLLHASNTAYDTYMEGGSIIAFFLGPSVVALGVPLYVRLRELREAAPAVFLAVVFGAIVGVAGAVVPAVLAGAPAVLVRSLAPKSVTTPIAMAIADGMAGEPSLTAVFVVATGIIGATIGPSLLRIFRVNHPIAIGIAMGCAAHGIGTARALEDGDLHGAAASLGICLCGVMTSLVAPALTGLLMR